MRTALHQCQLWRFYYTYVVLIAPGQVKKPDPNWYESPQFSCPAYPNGVTSGVIHGDRALMEVAIQEEKMKLTKLMLSIASGLLLTFLMVGLTLVAPAPATHLAQHAVLDPTIAPTVTITPTTPHTHPVALAISLYFHLPYTEVLTLHDSGFGFGVIARAYLTARASNGVLSPTQVLEMFQSGMGWGQFKQPYGIRPGGNGLGSIMSGKAASIPEVTSVPSTGMKPNGKPAPNSLSPGNPAACPGKSCKAPGHSITGKGPKK
jgi:hypothetical protein